MPIILIIKLIALFVISSLILSILRICNIIEWSWVYIATPLVFPAICGIFKFIILRRWYWILGICSILLSMLLMDYWGFIIVSWWDLYIILILVFSATPIGAMFVLLEEEI